jgi:hypothetical protein
MTKQRFPNLDPEGFLPTRDALHAYSRILGGWTSTARPKRKHWWHASLRPCLCGVTTALIHAQSDFEVELSFRESTLSVRTAIGERLQETLQGQSVSELSGRVRDFLLTNGISDQLADEVSAKLASDSDRTFAGYSAEEANKLARALAAVTASLAQFRATIREETSPIQLWPHHFDLAMLWLPGDKVPGQDPDNEEYADKQMNFGFTFGDASIPEPYFYVTAYPLPDGFPSIELPSGTEWRTDGFTGAVLTYERLLEESDPNAYLQQLWQSLQADGILHLVNHSN